jgi:hypothetical protein
MRCFVHPELEITQAYFRSETVAIIEPLFDTGAQRFIIVLMHGINCGFPELIVCSTLPEIDSEH